MSLWSQGHEAPPRSSVPVATSVPCAVPPVGTSPEGEFAALQQYALPLGFPKP